jgi:dihydroxyacetone kinase DhaKLM complex PTS-EIIA-like component DhaM
MDRVYFIEHKGKRILFLDFSDCYIEEALKVVDEAKQMIRGQPSNSLLTLTDVTGARFNTELTNAMKELASHNKPFVKAAAIVGITGMKKIIYDAVMRFSKRKISTFDDIGSAKDWLATN